MITIIEMHKEKCASEILEKIDVLQAFTWLKKAWDSVTPETIQKCFRRCCFQAGNEGEEGRFISFLYVCAGVTNYQYFAILLNNRMLVTVIHYFLVLNYDNLCAGNKRRSLKFSNKLCMLFSLQKLLHRNHEYSIQLFTIIMQSPGFCIAFFYNKILSSFYYICYLLENETLDSLDEVLGTDDDHPKVDFDVIAQKVFGASIQEIIDIKSEVITCDDTIHDWDAAADDILENIQRDEEEEQEESDDDEGNENTFDTIIPDFLLLSIYISAVKNFAINNGMSAAVTDMASAETVMERKFLQRRNNATQKYVTDYF